MSQQPPRDEWPNNQWDQQPNDQYAHPPNDQWGQPQYSQPGQPSGQQYSQPGQPSGQQYSQPGQPSGQQYSQQQPPPQQYVPPPPPPGQYGGYQPAPPTKRRGCAKPLLLGLLGLVVLCAVGGYLLFQRGKSEVNAATTTIDQLMQAGKNNDVSAGLAQFSQIARDQGTDEAAVASFFDNRPLFEDYQSTDSLSGINLSTDTASGTTAELRGDMKYSSGPNATYVAQMIKEGDNWRIVRIDVNRSGSQ